MGRSRITLVAVLALALGLAAVPAAQAKTRVFPVHLTIEVNASGHSIHGDVVSGAGFEMCESAKVKVRQALPGKDKTVAKVKPKDKEWRFDVPADLRGNDLYVETSAYTISGRDVRCLGSHSKTVTAL